MDYRFDRLYKYEITDALKKKGIDVRDHFHIEVTITAPNGTVLSSDLLSEPSIIFDPKSREFSGLFIEAVTLDGHPRDDLNI